MRGVRFTKAEAAYLVQMVDAAGDPAEARNFFAIMPSPKEFKLQQAILAKMRAAEAPAEAGVNAGALEQALIKAARGKVVQLVGTKVYPRVSRQATAIGATAEDAAMVGAWMAAQHWLNGPFTVLTVLNKWSDWLARAKATAGPNLGPGAPGASPATTAGRRAPGIR